MLGTTWGRVTGHDWATGWIGGIPPLLCPHTISACLPLQEAKGSAAHYLVATWCVYRRLPSGEKTLARPKSAILSWPEALMRRLAGFRSWRYKRRYTSLHIAHRA